MGAYLAEAVAKLVQTAAAKPQGVGSPPPVAGADERPIAPTSIKLHNRDSWEFNSYLVTSSVGYSCQAAEKSL